MTFETFDQSDEGTWPYQQKDNDKDKYILKTPSKSDPDQQKDNDENNDKDKDNDKDNDNDTYI